MASKYPARDRLFETAAHLFYADGYRATGVDTIAARSGIAKMTLYRHFPSKDDLVLAFLADSDREFWERFEEIAAAVHTSAGKLQAFFDALQGYVASPACHGCPFLNAAAEYPDPGHPVHRVAADHKLSVRRRFHQLATAAGARDPDALADALVLLMDGAYMSARLFAAAPQAPAVRLGAGASTLLRAHLGPNAGGAEPPCP